MKRAAAAALCMLAMFAGRADADAEADADRAFHEASAANDIGALEALGAARPITRWSDDAWSEAGRIAVRQQDFARARSDFEQVIAIGTDDQLVRRATAELARLNGLASWESVAREDQRLTPTLHAGGDPRPVLQALEKLVRDHPGYPRAPYLMITIASGWEREGESARAIDWLRKAQQASATAEERLRTSADLVRTLIRTGELDTAALEITAITSIASPGLVASLRDMHARAALRRTLRWIMWGVLAALLAGAAIALRRSAGSWKAAGRRLVRPPIEVLFLLPIGGILIAVAHTGNPLVAGAVTGIVIGGVITSWLSGAVLEGHGRIRLRRALAHAAIALIAILAMTYLAVDRGQLINFVIETWRGGHERG